MMFDEYSLTLPASPREFKNNNNNVRFNAIIPAGRG